MDIMDTMDVLFARAVAAFELEVHELSEELETLRPDRLAGCCVPLVASPSVQSKHSFKTRDSQRTVTARGWSRTLVLPTVRRRAEPPRVADSLPDRVAAIGEVVIGPETYSLYSESHMGLEDPRFDAKLARLNIEQQDDDDCDTDDEIKSGALPFLKRCIEGAMQLLRVVGLDSNTHRRPSPRPTACRLSEPHTSLSHEVLL